MRGHVPTQPSSSRLPSLHGCWGQPCTASSRSGAPQPCALAFASSAAATVEKVVDRRVLLAANAADGRPAGGEVDGGDYGRVLLLLGPARRAADGRDAPVEKGQ